MKIFDHGFVTLKFRIMVSSHENLGSWFRHKKMQDHGFVAWKFRIMVSSHENVGSWFRHMKIYKFYEMKTN